jgi:protein SCO1/2
VQRIYRVGKLGFLVTVGLVVLATAGVAIGLASTGAGSIAPPPASVGDQMDRSLPAPLRGALFSDQAGVHLSLGGFAGRVVLLVPFLTSCQEECPVTTGALLGIERALVADHLQHEVAIVEVTVDPGRDSPERMAAYAKLTGVSWPLLTAAPGTIAALWHYLGIYAQVVPEGSPPGIDWQTKTPYTYDVDHSDGFALFDPQLHERFIAAGMARNAPLRPVLRRLLDAQGEADRAHPGGGNWTVGQALNAIGWVLGQPVAGPTTSTQTISGGTSTRMHSS